jgi:hypothetical protein
MLLLFLVWVGLWPSHLVTNKAVSCSSTGCTEGVCALCKGTRAACAATVGGEPTMELLLLLLLLPPGLMLPGEPMLRSASSW